MSMFHHYQPPYSPYPISPVSPGVRFPIVPRALWRRSCSKPNQALANRNTQNHHCDCAKKFYGRRMSLGGEDSSLLQVSILSFQTGTHCEYDGGLADEESHATTAVSKLSQPYEMTLQLGPRYSSREHFYGFNVPTKQRPRLFSGAVTEHVALSVLDTLMKK